MSNLPKCVQFDRETPIDFRHMEHYDGSQLKLVAYSNGQFKHNGRSIAFSNMATSPIDFKGERFHSVETAYIACDYSRNDPECIRIQREIQACTNGLRCKRKYRFSAIDRQHGRPDFHAGEWHFNLMLYLVWQKCQQHPEFRDMLLAIPADHVLIESQNPFAAVHVGDWGCKNYEALKAYKQRVRELEARGMTGKVRIKNQATVDTWNIGVWEGCNHQGKILMACRAALLAESEPYIRYDLLNAAEIFLFGRLLQF